MRGLTFLVLSFLLVACGKSGSGGGSRQEEQAQCMVNGEAVNCDTINDGASVDLLETMIDVPVSLSEDTLTFLADKKVASQGNRISCDTKVRNGEIYRLIHNGRSLEVMTSNGSYVMEKNDDGDALLGSWRWQGREANGAFIIKTMFLFSNRAILKTHCEM